MACNDCESKRAAAQPVEVAPRVSRARTPGDPMRERVGTWNSVRLQAEIAALAADAHDAGATS